MSAFAGVKLDTRRLGIEGPPYAMRKMVTLVGRVEEQEPKAPSSEARRGGRMGQKETGMTSKNRIMIFGPKTDGTYVVEFRTAAGEALAISIPRTEASVVTGSNH